MKMKPTMQELKANVFDHIFYEMEMYLVTFYYFNFGDAYFYDRNIQTNDKQFASNLLIEGHQHYARNLIEFFSSKEKGERRDDDLRYSDILKEDVTIPINKYEKGLGIAHICNILNKGISHLTGFRTKCGLMAETISILKKLYYGDEQEYLIGLEETISNFLSLLCEENIKKNLQYKIDGVEVKHDLEEEFDDGFKERLTSLQELILKIKKK